MTPGMFIMKIKFLIFVLVFIHSHYMCTFSQGFLFVFSAMYFRSC